MYDALDANINYYSIHALVFKVAPACSYNVGRGQNNNIHWSVKRLSPPNELWPS